MFHELDEELVEDRGVGVCARKNYQSADYHCFLNFSYFWYECVCGSHFFGVGDFDVSEDNKKVPLRKERFQFVSQDLFVGGVVEFESLV